MKIPWSTTDLAVCNHLTQVIRCQPQSLLFITKWTSNLNTVEHTQCVTELLKPASTFGGASGIFVQAMVVGGVIDTLLETLVSLNAG